jgi:transcription factor MYB, plant
MAAAAASYSSGGGAFIAPATPPALSPAGSASSSVTTSSSGGGNGFFAAFPQPQGLVRFDAPPCRSPTELAPVPPASAGLDAAGGVWGSAPALDDVFLPELGGGDQLFSYGDFFGGLQPQQDRALELSACYFPNMAEMWGGGAADQAHAKPQGLCNTLM